MNLLDPGWPTIDADELATLLFSEFTMSNLQPNGCLAYPYAGDECCVEVEIDEDQVAAIRAGPAFDSAAWDRVVAHVETKLISGSPAVGRAVAFAGSRVGGFWASRHGIQILPPPVDAPRAPVELADHPFTLEFPVRRSPNGGITILRRFREYRRLTRLLNVLVVPGVTDAETQQPRHAWVLHPETKEPLWAQESFFLPGYPGVVDEPSVPTGEPLAVVPVDEYYATHDKRPSGVLSVPSDLDKSLAWSDALSRLEKRRLFRATYWFELAGRQWSVSRSVSFVALVAAIEALASSRTGHEINCPVCGEHTFHQKPSATKQFRDFVERYANGSVDRNARDALYGLRSRFVHGGAMHELDLPKGFGPDARELAHYELHTSLWAAVRTVVRSWLRSPEG